MPFSAHPSKWSYCKTLEIEIYARADSHDSYWRIIIDCDFQRDWSHMVKVENSAARMEDIKCLTDFATQVGP